MRPQYGRPLSGQSGHCRCRSAGLSRMTRDRRCATIGRFTTQTQMPVYFAHPHSPWERGTNENTNGLLRQVFPAGTHFNKVSWSEIQRVQTMLNDRPRKILNWHSPAHAFHHLLR